MALDEAGWWVGLPGGGCDVGVFAYAMGVVIV
jgi:hypothetical protein